MGSSNTVSYSDSNATSDRNVFKITKIGKFEPGKMMRLHNAVFGPTTSIRDLTVKIVKSESKTESTIIVASLGAFSDSFLSTYVT